MKDTIYIGRYKDGMMLDNKKISKEDYILLYYVQQFYHECGHIIYQSNISTIYSDEEEQFCDSFSYEFMNYIYIDDIFVKYIKLYNVYFRNDNGKYVDPNNYNMIGLSELFQKYNILININEKEKKNLDLNFNIIVDEILNLVDQFKIKFNLNKIYLCDSFNYINKNESNAFKGIKIPVCVALTDYDYMNQNIENLEEIYSRKEEYYV